MKRQFILTIIGFAISLSAYSQTETHSARPHAKSITNAKDENASRQLNDITAVGNGSISEPSPLAVDSNKPEPKKTPNAAQRIMDRIPSSH